MDWRKKCAIPASSPNCASLAPILLSQLVVAAAALSSTSEIGQGQPFPEGVVIVTGRSLADSSDPFPEELRAIASATTARQQDFALGWSRANGVLAVLR